METPLKAEFLPLSTLSIFSYASITVNIYIYMNIHMCVYGFYAQMA